MQAGRCSTPRNRRLRGPDARAGQAKAAEFGIPKACSVDELLADPEIEIVVNLTIPKAHAEVALAALQAGKQCYNEKPLAVSREDGSSC